MIINTKSNMNAKRCIVILLANVIVIMRNFHIVTGTDESNGCSNQEYSPLCFCRTSYQHSSLTNLFLAKLSLFQCDNFLLPIHHCRQSQFQPPSFHLTQFIPPMINHSHCLKDIHCLHTLHSIQYCQQCQLTRNDSYRIDICFNFCEQNPSCGNACLNQSIMISIDCNKCQKSKETFNCHCINLSPSCLPLSYESATPRWMQKRGFPAAAILVLLILAVVLLVIVIQLIYRKLDNIDQRHSIITAHQSILPIQNYQTSSTLHSQTQQSVMEIHRCDEENESSILLY